MRYLLLRRKVFLVFDLDAKLKGKSDLAYHHSRHAKFGKERMQSLRVRDDESTRHREGLSKLQSSLEGHLHSLKLIVLFCGDIKPLKNQKDSIKGFLKRNAEKFTAELDGRRQAKGRRGKNRTDIELAFEESPSVCELFDSDFVFDYIDFARNVNSRKDGSDELLSFMNLADAFFNLRYLEMRDGTGEDVMIEVMLEVARCVECKEGSALAKALEKYILSDTRSKDFDEIVNDVYREFGKAFSASLTLF